MEADCQISNNNLNLKCWEAGRHKRWEAKASDWLIIALPPPNEMNILWQKTANIENRWHKGFCVVPTSQPPNFIAF